MISYNERILIPARKKLKSSPHSNSEHNSSLRCRKFMEQHRSNQENVTPVPCRNNCGFFGSPATNNFCSKCYKKYYFRSLASSVDFRDNQTDEIEGAPVVDLAVERVEPSAETPVQSDLIKQPANRCAVCNRKVGLMGFKCRCENVFCSVHRYSDKHGCSFDYREAGQNRIAKANPIVKADKIDRI